MRKWSFVDFHRLYCAMVETTWCSVSESGLLLIVTDHLMLRWTGGDSLKVFRLRKWPFVGCHRLSTRGYFWDGAEIFYEKTMSDRVILISFLTGPHT